eukprot:XP_001701366.1 predicted protein [Chlamydomonas reinhardtii]
MAAAGVMERVGAALAAGDYGGVCGLLDEAELAALAPWGAAAEGGGGGPAAGGGAAGVAAGADGGAAAPWPAALHLLSHVYAGNLADARLLLKRMPEGVRADPQVAAAARLLQCAWQGSGEGVWRALRGHPWSGPAGQLVEALAERLRARQLDLVEQAYSHISAARLAALCLSIIFWEGEEAGAHDVIQHPALLASLYMAGVGADVARNITELRLEGPLELPTLVTVALVLAGTLRHVRILALDTQLCGMGSYSFNNMHALHTTLRAAFPALEELNLPARACLRGLEAFAGSHLHTVRVMAESPGSLRMSHVRSLVQLPQLLQLDLDGGDWDACWSGDSDDDVWDDEKADSPAGAAELPLGDASDEETFREMEEEQVWDLWALRRLLVSPPPALERLRWLAEPRQEVGFAGGRIACVDLHGGADGPDLHRAAATLLPALAATGRRLPLLKVNYLVGYPADVISQLQPHTPFSRLLAATDRVELGHLSMVDGTAAEAAAALQAVVRARTCGPDGAASGGGAARLKEWLESLVARSPPPATAAAAAVAPGSPAGTAAAAEAPGEVKVSVCKEGADEDWTPVIHAVIRELWDDHLGSAPVMAMPTGTAAAAGQGLAARGAPEAGGDRQAAGSAATPAAPAAVMLAEVTAQQVLEQAAARMWDTAEAEAAATVAQAEAWMAYRTAYVADKSRYRHDMRAVRMYVLLRGPFVWQRTCGPAKAGGRGAARLKESGAAAAASPGSPADAAAGAPREWKVQRGSFAGWAG